MVKVGVSLDTPTPIQSDITCRILAHQALSKPKIKKKGWGRVKNSGMFPQGQKAIAALSVTLVFRLNWLSQNLCINGNSGMHNQPENWM